MVWTVALIVVLCASLAAACWRLRQRPWLQAASGRGPDEIDRWLASEFGLDWRDGSQVRRAVLAGQGTVSGPALEAAARGLAAGVLDGQFRALRTTRAAGWLWLAGGPGLAVFGLSLLLAARQDGARAMAAADVLSGVVMVLGGWLTVRAQKRTRRNAARFLQFGRSPAPGRGADSSLTRCGGAAARVTVPIMEVTFTKLAGRRYEVAITREHGPRLAPRGGPGYHDYLPHDAVHFLVESEAGLAGGVFGRVAAGQPGFFWPADQALMRKHGRRQKARRPTPAQHADMARSEALAGTCRVLWESRAGHLASLPEWFSRVEAETLESELVQRIVDRLDKFAAWWHALPIGGSITLAWPLPSPPLRSQSSRSRTVHGTAGTRPRGRAPRG